jgi:hypothetical protein
VVTHGNLDQWLQSVRCAVGLTTKLTDSRPAATVGSKETMNEPVTIQLQGGAAVRVQRLVRQSTVPCPYCGQEVGNAWKSNSEYVLRCPMPCAQLFAVRTHGASIQTARIDWNGGELYWLPDATLAQVLPNDKSSDPAQ